MVTSLKDSLQKNADNALLTVWAPYIREMVLHELPNTYYLSVAGSIVNGGFNPGSDIDVLALVESEEPPYNSVHLRCPGCENRMLEVTTLPLFRLLQYMDLAPRMGIPGILEEVGKARLLWDRDGLAPVLQNRAMELLNLGPAPMDDQTRKKFRIRIADQLANARHAEDVVEQRLGMQQLTTTLMDAILSHDRQWRGTSQHRYLWRRLNKCDSTYARNLCKAISLQNVEDIFFTSQEVLNLLGGAPEDGFNIRR